MGKKVRYLKKEDGYILIIIVGVFTILSLMAITFATLSRIETKATRNYSDSIKCEAIARAGLEHALYVLRQDKFGDDDIAYNNDNGDENYDWSGETWMPGGSNFSGTDYDNDGDGTNDSKWIYFPATASTSDVRLPGKLRARYAILITDDREARININVTGNKAGSGNTHTSNEGWSTFEIDLSRLIEQAPGLNSTDGDTIASDIIDKKLGTDLKPGTSTVNDNSGIIPNPQTDGVDNDGDWVLASHDSNNNRIPDSGETNVDEADETTDEPTEYNPVFPSGDDRPFGFLSEAEIMCSSTYTSRLEIICNNRGVSQSDQTSLNEWFTTCSADTIVSPAFQLDGGTSTTMLNVNALITNEGAYTDTVMYHSDKKVEMITDVFESGGITGSSGTQGYVERHQLAVNTIDFIDSDSVVTRYDDGTDVYYGVEKTPCINEVEAEVNPAVASGMGKFIELFNPYDISLNITNWRIEFGATTITITGPSIPAQGYYVIADHASAYQVNFSYQGGAAADQYDVGVNNLTPNGEVITLKDNNSNIVQVTNYGQADSTTNTRQLNDPRPTPLMDADGTTNINASIPWRWTTIPETAGEKNSSFNPTIGGDGWENTTPTWPLSFLVANRIFSNKGYLGFIHTGRQWSSFKVDQFITYPNVLEYLTITDPSMDGIDNDGDGDIDSADTGSQNGDINGKEYRIPGLINVNTAPSEVLQSLPNIDSTIANAIESSIDKPFTSIGDLVDDVSQITGTGNKWDREKRFRSISNLITTRSNVFTVYITTQICNESETDIFSEKKLLAIVDRSLDPVKIRYLRWVTN
ncbi:MAG: lamin tail domain-containing protein [Candidatus Scalindua sp.]|nr:lamin tail domain-containing protein [Candidatus Scalindua sp.]